MSDVEKELAEWRDKAYQRAAIIRKFSAEIEQLRKDNRLLTTCVKTAIEYCSTKNPSGAMNYLVRKLREAVSD